MAHRKHGRGTGHIGLQVHMDGETNRGEVGRYHVSVQQEHVHFCLKLSYGCCHFRSREYLRLKFPSPTHLLCVSPSNIAVKAPFSS